MPLVPYAVDDVVAVDVARQPGAEQAAFNINNNVWTVDQFTFPREQTSAMRKKFESPLA